MNPLSSWTFYRRHKGRGALLMSLIILVTAGLYLMGALVWGIYVEPGRQAYMALSRFSMVTLASGENDPGSGVVTQLQAHPDITKVIPTRVIHIQLPGMMPGENFQFDLLGLMKEDLPYIILERLGATLREGHLPGPGTNGLVLSKDVATMLDLKVGDGYGALSSEIYANMDAPPEAIPFEVVGILESDVEMAVVSLEFLNDHKIARQLPARFLVVARENREGAVDGYLRGDIQSSGVSVLTASMLDERIANEALPGLVMLLPVLLVVSIAFSLVVVVVNRIQNARRLSEFGLLHATGLSKQWLILRVTMETATLAVTGWAAGIGLSWLVLALLKAALFAPRGHDLDFIGWVPILFALPIPATVIGFTFVSVRRTLSRLDPVAVVERGELSLEGDRRQARTASKSSHAHSSSSLRPLASATFYKRHRRRAVLLISGMSLMIVAVALFIFILAVSADAKEPLLGYLSRVSMVRSPALLGDLAPEVIARVQAHPAVERVIPVAPRLHMLSANIPPFTGAEASPFGVYAEDMAYLVALYDLELKEGRLPRPESNEVIIPEALAQNRDLQVGDVIGNPDQPAYPGASSLPVEFVISGIFARPAAPEDGNWWGFVSLEYLERLEPFPMPDRPSLIVVPKAGQKGVLDEWLENELAGKDVSVLTHRQQVARVRQSAQSQMFAMALLQGAIAIVTAIALAVLNYIYVSQRQSEFGVLHALGYGRRQLVGRVLRETAYTTAMAWAFSVIIILGGMLYLKLGVFASLGLTFNLLNAGPWLYTIPIPVAVLAVTTGSTARTLSKLDPVTIIERRS
jgi:ABC-type lipoprotein release transport system permease subunit